MKTSSAGQKSSGGSLEDAAGSHVAEGDPRAAEHLEEVENPLPLAKAVHERGREGAHVVEEEACGHEMAGDALELGAYHPQVHRVLRDLDPGQLLDGPDVCQVVGHAGHVVEPVGKGDDLYVRARLRQLLGAPVEVAEDGLDVDHDLAVEGDPQAEHAVGAGMLRSQVYRYRLSLYHFFV